MEAVLADNDALDTFMSFGAGVATVFVSIMASLIAWIISRRIEERSSCISLWFLALAIRLHPEPERDEFLDEALGNLSQLEGQPTSAIGHALGLVMASLGIARSWKAEQALIVAQANSRGAARVSIPVRGWLWAIANAATPALVAPLVAAGVPIAAAYVGAVGAVVAVAVGVLTVRLVVARRVNQN